LPKLGNTSKLFWTYRFQHFITDFAVANVSGDRGMMERQCSFAVAQFIVGRNWQTSRWNHMTVVCDFCRLLNVFTLHHPLSWELRDGTNVLHQVWIAYMQRVFSITVLTHSHMSSDKP